MTRSLGPRCYIGAAPNAIKGMDKSPRQTHFLARMAISASVFVVKTDVYGDFRRATTALLMANGMEQVGQNFIEYDNDKTISMVSLVCTGANA